MNSNFSMVHVALSPDCFHQLALPISGNTSDAQNLSGINGKTDAFHSHEAVVSANRQAAQLKG